MAAFNNCGLNFWSWIEHSALFHPKDRNNWSNPCKRINPFFCKDCCFKSKRPFLSRYLESSQKKLHFFVRGFNYLEPLLTDDVPDDLLNQVFPGFVLGFAFAWGWTVASFCCSSILRSYPSCRWCPRRDCSYRGFSYLHITNWNTMII